MKSRDRKITIIFPIYNEEKRLILSLKEIKKFSISFKKRNLELIFVNDGSKDNSFNLIKDFKKRNQKKIDIKLISYRTNKGKGFAVKTGILKSSKEWILICDCDLSVHPKQLIKWFNQKKILSRETAYFGSRVHQNSIIKADLTRIILGFFFKKILKYLLQIELGDTQCGFKLFNKRGIKKVFRNLKSFGFAFDIELIFLLKNSKIKIVELPLKWVHKSGSKLNFFIDIPKMLFEILRIKKRINKNLNF